MANYIYLLSAQSYGRSGFTKIGITARPKKRIAEIQQGVPFGIICIAVFETEKAHEIEQDFLNKFSHLRIRGEWMVSVPRNIQNCSIDDFVTAANLEQDKNETKMLRYLIRRCGKESIKDALL